MQPFFKKQMYFMNTHLQGENINKDLFVDTVLYTIEYVISALTTNNLRINSENQH